MSKRGLWGGAIGALVMLAGQAHAADDPAKLAAAESLFQEGLRFKFGHDYAEACKRFALSEELAPAVGTLLNLGECHEALHETAQAWLAYRQAIGVAEAIPDKKRADRARAEAARVEPRVPRLTIALPAGPRAAVTRDGSPVEPAALNVAVAIDPGRHVISVTAPQRKSWAKTIDIAEGESSTVTVPELDATAPPPTPIPTPPPPEPTKSPRRAIGIGMEIGGGALLAVGLVSGAIALVKWHAVEHDCPNGGCPRAIANDRQNDVDAARAWATVSTVGLISGAVILGAGVALHLTAPSDGRALARSGRETNLKDQLSLAPIVGRETAGFSLVWRR